MASEGLGRAKGGIGGKGEEYDDQHGGKAWRFGEGGARNGGIGVDSSEDKLGKEGIDRSRYGGIDKVEGSRILMGDCRVVVEVESCNIVGELKKTLSANLTWFLFEDNC